jgi:hypothetical protein
MKAAKVEIRTVGYRATGIYPFNQNAILDHFLAFADGSQQSRVFLETVVTSTCPSNGSTSYALCSMEVTTENSNPSQESTAVTLNFIPDGSGGHSTGELNLKQGRSRTQTTSQFNLTQGRSGGQTTGEFNLMQGRSGGHSTDDFFNLMKDRSGERPPVTPLNSCKTGQGDSTGDFFNLVQDRSRGQNPPRLHQPQSREDRRTEHR